MPRKIVIPVTVDDSGVKQGTKNVKSCLTKSAKEISDITNKAGGVSQAQTEAGLNKTMGTLGKLKDRVVSIYDSMLPKAKAAKAQLEQKQIIYEQEEEKLKELQSLRERIQAGDQSLLKINSPAIKNELKDVDGIIKITQQKLDKINAKAEKVKAKSFRENEVETVVGSKTIWANKAKQKEFLDFWDKSNEKSKEYNAIANKINEAQEKYNNALSETTRATLQNNYNNMRRKELLAAGNKEAAKKIPKEMEIPYSNRQIGAYKGAVTKLHKENDAHMAKLKQDADELYQKAINIQNKYSKVENITKTDKFTSWIGGGEEEQKYNDLIAQADILSQKLAELKAQREAVFQKGAGRAKDEALEKIDKQINKVINDLQLLGINIDKIKRKVKDAENPGISALDKFITRVKNLAKRVFIFTVITRLFRSMRDNFSALLAADEGYQQSLNELKTALWTAFTPIYEFIVPALKTLMRWLTICINVMIRFYTIITGRSLDDLRKKAKALQDTAKGAKKAAKDVKDANKTLLGIDEINRLDDKTKFSTPSGGGNEEFDSSKITGDISEMLLRVAAIIGGCLVALGVVLIFMHQVALGIGFIVAGAALEFGVVAVALSDEELPIGDRVLALKTVMITTTVMVVVGLCILFLTAPPTNLIGLALVAAGALMFWEATAIAAEQGELKEELTKNLGIIKALVIADFAMVIIGAVLVFFVAPIHIKLLGLALIAAGAFGLWGISKLDSDDGALAKEITEMCNDLTAIISPFVAILGIITLASGHIIIGLSLLVAGIGLFLHSYVMNDGGSSITDSTRQVLQGILRVISVALLAIGVILLLVPGHKPLAIGLIVAGAVALYSSKAVTLDSNGIITNATRMLNSIKLFATGAGKVALGVFMLMNPFTIPLGLGMIWDGLRYQFNAFNPNSHPILYKIKTFINSVIITINQGVNNILKKLKRTAVVGPVLDALGFPSSIYIPRLAQGAVIPANKEFMAVLGDQKNGRNLEAPEKLIRQIMREELTNGMNNGTIEVRVPVILDGNVLFESIAKVNNDKVKMTGSSPLLV